MQNCNSIVTMVFDFNQLLHCIGMACIMLEMMMSVLQEVKGLKKKL